MPILLKARPVIGIVSFSWYFNNESQRTADFKGKGQRSHFSMGGELMNLQSVLICHKHNSSCCIFAFISPCLPYTFLFKAERQHQTKYLCTCIMYGL